MFRRGSSEFHAWGDFNLYLRRDGDDLSLSVEHRAAPSMTPITIELAQRGDRCRFRKLKFVHIDGAIRRGSDAQQCLRTARLGVCRAHPSRAKCELVLHCNRCCISQEFAEGALR